MLGIIIGVASIVSLVAVGQGATAGITAQLAGLGTNLLTVNPGSSVFGVTRQAAGSAATLTFGDAEAIARIEGVAGVAPERATQRVVVAGDENTTTSIVGTTEAYADVRSETPLAGHLPERARGRSQPAGGRPRRLDSRHAGPRRG